LDKLCFLLFVFVEMPGLPLQGRQASVFNLSIQQEPRYLSSLLLNPN
jgi:hypothetical protein